MLYEHWQRQPGKGEEPGHFHSQEEEQCGGCTRTLARGMEWKWPVSPSTFQVSDAQRVGVQVVLG